MNPPLHRYHVVSERGRTRKRRRADSQMRKTDLFSHSKIFPNREGDLLEEHLLECRDVILLIEEKQRRPIVVRCDGTERERTAAMGNQHRVRHEAARALVAIHERLNVRNQQKRQQSLLVRIRLAVDEPAHIVDRLANLRLDFQRTVIRTRNADTDMSQVPVDTQALDDNSGNQ